MDEFWWPLLWALAGLPVVSAAAKHDLSRRSSRDYAYYMEWKLFSISKLAIAKLGLFVSIGVTLTVLSISFEKMTAAVSIAAVCGFLLESTTLIGRTHPTPEYTRDRACVACRSNEHDGCTNLRMLDGFENNFVSREGVRRPVCCCGFRIAVIRALNV